MNAPDTLKRLEGEPEIPSLTPRGGASSHKPIIAASVLILSLVGALGFAATYRGLFSKLDGQVLGRFVLHFALPAMLFNTLTQRDFAEVMNPRFLLAYGAGSMLSFAIGFGVWRLLRKKSWVESSMVAMGVSTSSSRLAAARR